MSYIYDAKFIFAAYCFSGCFFFAFFSPNFWLYAKQSFVRPVRPSKLYHLHDKPGGEFWRCPVSNKFRKSCCFYISDHKWRKFVVFLFNIGSDQILGDNSANVYNAFRTAQVFCAQLLKGNVCHVAVPLPTYNTLRPAVNGAMLKSST